MKEKRRKYADIMVRATVLGLMNKEDATDRMMDIESADLKFNMRLDDWLKADDFNFAHDFLGIRDNIVRNKFPSKDFGFFRSEICGCILKPKRGSSRPVSVRMATDTLTMASRKTSCSDTVGNMAAVAPATKCVDG